MSARANRTLTALKQRRKAYPSDVIIIFNDLNNANRT